jgi:hypothetical protein
MISTRIDPNASCSFAVRSLRALRVSAGAVVLAIVATGAACGGSTATPKEDAKDSGAGGEGGPTTTPVDGGGGAPTTSDAGSKGNADAGASATEAGPGPGNGAPSTTYPAFTVDVAKVIANGGPVLKAPVVVTITWSSDPDAATYNALGDAMGPSTYWKDVSSEYGVGPTASGSPNHISITTAAPTTISDDELDSMVETNAGTAWPAPDDNTLYAIYLPPGAALTSGGQNLCQEGVGGYHTESNNKNYVYAIMPHCSGFQTADVELGASHELNEAATDPHPGTNPAWVGFDDDHLSFELFNQFQDELGDACESYVEATDPTDLTPYTVQRQWSNESAAAGSHWCVPKLAEPFYNTTFLPQTNLDSITVNLDSVFPGAGSTTSKGIKIPVNTARTFPIGLFSDQATSAPFTIDVQGTTDPITQDQNGNDVANGAFTVSLDLASGLNGQIANVTVTPTSYSTLGINFFYIRAVLPGAQQHHYLPIIISAN